MLLDHPDLEAFEPTLRKIFAFAFTAGIRVLASAGLTMKDIDRDEAARRRFLRGCHYGYDRAQRQIASIVADLEHKRRALDNGIRELRRRRNPAIAVSIAKERVLESRQLLLRRVIDSILFTIVGFNPWIVKRFTAQRQIRRIDPDVVLRTTDTVSRLNAESRYIFGVVADLSTIIDIGDLLRVDLTPGRRKSWELIELKEGKMNQLLSEVIRDSSSADDETFQRIRETLGERAVVQARRMLRQQARLHEAKRILETDRGVDAVLKREIHLTPEVLEVEDYREAIRTVIRRARDHRLGLASVDRSLRVLGIQGDLSGTQGGLLGVRHAFYHMQYTDAPCRLETDGAQAELQEMRAVAPFVDLVEQSMRSRWGYPVFLWMLEEETVFDLVFGRIRIFAQFDIGHFRTQIETLGYATSWLTGKDAETVKPLSGRIPGSPDAWGIRVTIDEETNLDYLLGFFGRVITELLPPRELLRMIRFDARRRREG